MDLRSLFLSIAGSLLLLGIAGCAGDPPYSRITQRSAGAYIRFVNTLDRPATFFVGVNQATSPVPAGMGSPFVREAMKKHRVRAEIGGKTAVETDLELKEGDVISGILIEEEGRLQLVTAIDEPRLPKGTASGATVACISAGADAASATLRPAESEPIALSPDTRHQVRAGSAVLAVGSDSQKVALESGVCYTVLLYRRDGKLRAALLRNTPRDFIYTQAQDGKAG